MTTTELIELLQKTEKGASGRSREIRIYTEDENGDLISLMQESDSIDILSTGDGCAGAEISLIIKQ
jgi:hypothetical protein